MGSKPLLELKSYDPWIDWSNGELDKEVYEREYPLKMEGGGRLFLPFRPFESTPHRALALFMATQCSLYVRRALSLKLAQAAMPFNPDTVVGVPSLGWVLADRVSALLGHDHWTALTNTKKYWQDPKLSVDVDTSITSGGGKKLYLDQNILDRVERKTVVIVDDCVSTGGNAAAAINLLRVAGASEIYLVLVFVEGNQWQKTFAEMDFDWRNNLAALGKLPIFERVDDPNTGNHIGWKPIPD